MVTATCPFCQGAGTVPAEIPPTGEDPKDFVEECPDCDGEGVIASKRKEKPEPIGIARIRGIPRGHPKAWGGGRMLVLDQWPAIWEVLDTIVEGIDPAAEVRAYFNVSQMEYVIEVLERAGFTVDLRGPEESR